MSKKLVLIDGHSILNRAFYGLPDLTSPTGQHTNAVYGFLNILFKILAEEVPDYLAVAFDVHAKTFRHEMYEAYKGTRSPMPPELREQVPLMKQVLHAMGVFTIEQAGLEADDILGTLAKAGEKEGMQVSLVSGDRDLLQIASDNIKIRIPSTKGGKTEINDFYAKDVLAKYEVTPHQFIELKALMGDTADNIPGVPKVGPKTATELMVKYGSIDGIYEHIEEITKKSIKATLIENRDLADLSKKLATICVTADIAYSFEDAKVGELFTPQAYELFVSLGFKNLLSRFDETVSTSESLACQTLRELNEVTDAFTSAGEAGRLAYQIFEEDGQLLGIALTFDDRNLFVMPDGLVTQAYLKDAFAKLTEKRTKESLPMLTFDAKNSYAYFGTDCIDGVFDCKLAAYLMNPLHSEYTLEDVANEYLGVMPKDRATLFGKSTLKKALTEQEELFVTYACGYSYVADRVYEKLLHALIESNQKELFDTIEMPLTYVLYDMQQNGVCVHAEALKEYGQQLSVRIDELEQSIYEQVGEQFNINSPKQLGEILFVKMGIPGGKKTKTGYSTAADVLEKLAVDYPVVKDILEYRGLAKLKSTYAEGLYDCIKEDGKIHTTYNQMITATGRLSSTEPNLQNIPMRMELGRMIRKVFVPKEGYVFMDADYSQIELRILAHMSGDEGLIADYRSGRDIHSITASKVFHVPIEEVTPLMRRNAKAVNFGVVYGISSFGLSQDLDISKSEAQEYINHYFETYPGIKLFLDQTVADAKQNGYTTTMFGRRRPIPELASSNFMQRSFGERAAMNAPIQGTAADIMKIAMVRVYQALKEKKLRSRLILQVHDELVLEVHEEEVAIAKQILTDAMMHAAQLAVELAIDLHTGKDWYEAK